PRPKAGGGKSSTAQGAAYVKNFAGMKRNYFSASPNDSIRPNGLSPRPSRPFSPKNGAWVKKPVRGPGERVNPTASSRPKRRPPANQRRPMDSRTKEEGTENNEDKP